MFRFNINEMSYNFQNKEANLDAGKSISPNNPNNTAYIPSAQYYKDMHCPFEKCQDAQMSSARHCQEKRGKSMAAPTKRPPAVHLHRSQEVSSSLLSPSCYLLPPGNRDMVGKRSNFAHVITFRQLIERGKATPLQLVGKKSVRKNIPNLCHVEICFMLPYEKV